MTSRTRRGLTFSRADKESVVCGSLNTAARERRSGYPEGHGHKVCKR